MFLWCCERKADDENQVDEGQNKSDTEQNLGGDDINHSWNKMLFNRIGRVEKFKHGGTVLFLGKAFVMAILIIVLVKFISDSEVCYLEGNLGQLPDGVQRILLEKNSLQSYRCPYDSKLDVAYTFSLEHDDHDNETLSGEVTAIKVNIADVVPSKINNDYLSSDNDSVTATQLCGKMCSVKSCKCFTKMIFSSACYLDVYEYGLQIDEVEEDGARKKGLFSIYFVISVFILIFSIVFYAVYRLVTGLCGGKRAGTANIG